MTRDRARGGVMIRFPSWDFLATDCLDDGNELIVYP